MSRKINKIISIFLAVICFSVCVTTGAFAKTDDKVIAKIMGLGIMQGFEDGTFGEEQQLTRAQMAMVTAKLLRVDNLSGSNSVFSDVPNDHWAQGAISILADMGILNGIGNGTYSPEENVRKFDAIKIMVNVLGYSIDADRQGGYPYGYLAVAGKLGIVKNVPINDGYMTRGELAQMIYDSLEVRMLQPIFSDKFEPEDRTFFEVLQESNNTVGVDGILQETERTSIIAQEPSVEENEILLSGVKYACDINMDKYLGQRITIYAYEDVESGLYKLKTFVADRKNELFSEKAENVNFTNDKVMITDDGKRKKDISLADSPIVIYNGRREQFDPVLHTVPYGEIRLLDNNNDNKIEIIFIDEAQSFIVKKVSVSNSTIYFKNNATFRGRNAFFFDAGNEDKKIYLEDASGKSVQFEDIEEDMAVTLFVSKDELYIKAILSSEKVEGKIDQLEEDYVYIDSKKYGVALKPDGTSYFTPKLGDNTIYAVDMYGNIINSCVKSNDGYLYAYVIDAGRKSGISNNLQIKIVTGKTPTKEVKIEKDEEKITYYFQNDFVEVLSFANKVKFDERRISPEEINADELLKSVIAYKLNENGEIKELRIKKLVFPENDYTFNGKIVSFGGATAFRGFASDNNTVYICVPEEERGVEDDYYVQIKVDDGSATNRVVGTVFIPDGDYEDPDSEPVDIMLIRGSMNSSEVPFISSSNDICIVGNVRGVKGTLFDDEDSFVYEIEMLNGENRIKEVTRSTGVSYEIASKLRKGDLIRYEKDGFGRIVNIKKIASLQGLGNDLTREYYLGAGSESASYGIAYHTVIDSYDYYLNQLVDRITLSYNEDGTLLSNQFRLPHEDPPVMYKYNREDGLIYPATAEDVCTYTQIGADADKIFAVIENNDIKAFVIISD